MSRKMPEKSWDEHDSPYRIAQRILTMLGLPDDFRKRDPIVILLNNWRRDQLKAALLLAPDTAGGGEREEPCEACILGNCVVPHPRRAEKPEPHAIGCSSIPFGTDPVRPCDCGSEKPELPLPEKP